MKKMPTTRYARRHFLRGAGGIVLGLPLLESMGPKRARAQADKTPPVSAFIVTMNGVMQASDKEPEMFWPTKTGSLTTANLKTQTGRATSVLADYAPYLNIIKGMDLSFPGNGCGHSGGGNQVLTGHRVSDMPASNKSLAMGESVDQRIARAVNPQGREALGLYAGPKGGYINDHISFRGPKDLAVAESNPYRAYTRLVGMKAENKEQAALLSTRRKSVNDFVRDDLKRLLSENDLSKNDRRRLQLHQESIRDIEIRLTTELPANEVEAMKALEGTHNANHTRFVVERMQMDIMALALSAGFTRVAFLQTGDGSDGVPVRLPSGKVTPNFHMVSHRIYSNGSEGPPIEGAVEMHHEIDKVRMSQFVHFLDRMKMYEGPQGNLLDTGVVTWTNQIATGGHSYDSVPYLVAGRAGGYLRTGQFVDAGRLANSVLLNTLANAGGARMPNGAPVNDVGDAILPKFQLPDILAN